MKNITLIIIICVGSAGIWTKHHDIKSINNAPVTSSNLTVIHNKNSSAFTQKISQGASLSPITQAFKNRQSNIQILASGVVETILPDDNQGSKHQRFILKVADDHTVLVAHNIDLAPRIPYLQKGDQVEFYGEYEWNHKGGVIHWTHRDPRGNHPHGWLKHNGTTYQ